MVLSPCCSPGEVPPDEEDMSEFVQDLGVSPQQINGLRQPISLRDIAVIWKLFNLFRRFKPDVVHTHTAKAGAVGRVAAILYRYGALSQRMGSSRACKLVHTYHGHVFHGYFSSAKTNLFLWIERILGRFTDRIVVISKKQREELCERYRIGKPEKYSVIPLGIDLSRFSDSAVQKDDNRVRTVGIIGRLVKVKDHDLFLHCVKAFSDEYGETVRFAIIGDGQLRQSLEQRASSLGVSDVVEFRGNCEDQSAIYRDLDAVMLTSTNEGTPLTLIEAMASRRPVITTVVGGIPDLLGNSVDRTDEGYCVYEHGIGVSSRRSLCLGNWTASHTQRCGIGNADNRTSVLFL